MNGEYILYYSIIFNEKNLNIFVRTKIDQVIYKISSSYNFNNLLI